MKRLSLWILAVVVGLVLASQGLVREQESAGAVGPLSFVDSFSSAGLSDTGSGNGAVWFDYDNDDWLDLAIMTGPGSLTLFRSNGNGTFSDVSGSAGVGGSTDKATAADYDNDGYVDLLVHTGWCASNVLYHNNGNGTFTDLAAAAGIQTSCGSGSWADYDGDGWVDLLIARSDGVRLFRNNHNGTFSDVTSSTLPSVTGYAAAWLDFDGDGDQDLLVVNNAGPSRLYRNDNGTFTDVSVGSGLDRALGAVAIGDYNNDWRVDVFAGVPESYSVLLKNNGNGTFSDVTASVGISTGGVAGTSFGANLADYDNDGSLDIFVDRRRYGGTNQLYQDAGDGTFTEVASSAGVAYVGDTHDIASADYNRDGFVDVYEVNFTGGDGSTDILYRNNGNTNHWLEIDLTGNSSNRAGIGARVEVTAGSRTVARWVVANQTGYSQTELRLNFGLGPATEAQCVTVRWPSGKVQAIPSVSADQLLSVVEENDPMGCSAPPPTPTPTRTPTPTPTATPTNTPTPTRTPVPSTPTSTPPPHPPGVGGMVKLPPVAIAGEARAAAEGSGWSGAMYAALAAGVSAASAALGISGWFLRRRWLR